MFPYLSSRHESSSTYITPESGLSAKLEYRDHLIYFLYGAMIFMALKKWKRALLYLEIVIMSPVAIHVSKIQVDAYKKWVLVSLLYKGHVSDACRPKKVTRALSDNIICSLCNCRKQQVPRPQDCITQSAGHTMGWRRFSKMVFSTKSLIRDSSQKLRLVMYGGPQ